MSTHRKTVTLDAALHADLLRRARAAGTTIEAELDAAVEDRLDLDAIDCRADEPEIPFGAVIDDLRRRARI